MNPKTSNELAFGAAYDALFALSQQVAREHRPRVVANVFVAESVLAELRKELEK